jgi:hypothetical protein
MGRRSSAFVREDSGTATVLPNLWISISHAATWNGSPTGQRPDHKRQQQRTMR